ncbi:GNAT family N-acetyltransferase [Paenibacillus terrae]
MGYDIQSELKLSIKSVPELQKGIIVQLMQFYLYDFTAYLRIDVTENGTFPAYPDLYQYWTSGEQKLPFLIWRQDVPVGFALVDRMSSNREADFYMAEFFVLRPYRHNGVGTWAAHELFGRFSGRWKVTQMSTNRPAQSFWRKVIGSYTNGDYREQIHPVRGNISQFFNT